MSESRDAIVIRDVVKSFRRSTIRREYTSFKSELVRWLRGEREQKPRAAGTISALRGINLVIPRGKTVGILGRNGSGKSTLLKLITGIYTPTSGAIEVNGRISALLDLGAGFHPDFSGRENILINGIILGMTRAEVKARMNEIIAFSELGDFIDEPVRTYSSGMYMRLAFAVATHVDPDILIIDEILAVGDEHFAKKSLAKMTEFKKQGKTIVLVTHDLGTVERWCDLAAWIDGGRIRRVGPPGELAREYREAVALAEAQSVVFSPPALAEAEAAKLPEVPTTHDGSGPIEALQLYDAEGRACTSFDTESSLRVALVLPSAQVAARELCVRIIGADGRELFSTRQPLLPLLQGADVQEEQLRLSLVVERLGLLRGAYTLLVQLREQGSSGALVSERSHDFNVASSDSDTGLFRPPHRWSLDADRSRAEPALVRSSAS